MLRVLAMVLVLLLLVLGWQLFNGAGGIRDVDELALSVRAQQRENAQLTARNDALAAEVTDLKQGEAALEERARTELGMIKPGEVFYRVVDAGDLPPAAADKDSQRSEEHTSELQSLMRISYAVFCLKKKTK